MKRSGSTCVEFAFTAPILLLLVFATMEFWQVNTYRNMATEAAYEAARYGVLPGITADGVEQRGLDALSKVGARGAEVTVTPATITNQTHEVTVRVDLPVADNSWLFLKYFLPSHISRESTMVREMARFE